MDGARERGTAARNLSPREREVLELACLGLTNLEAGARLNISVHAVKFHLSAIYRKLDVANRTQAVVAYMRMQASADTAAPRERDS